MSKQASRRASGSQNLIVYLIVGALVIAAGLLVFNILRPPPKAPGELQWDEAPVMLIDTSKQYTATLKLDKGDIVIQLLPQAAPITVNNFVFLARQGFYDGVTFHRVLSGFVAQAGDPTGTGSGGPGYFIPNETSAGLKFDGPGVVAMANSGADRNGSQFFITYAAQPGLDGGFTIFGRVVAGMDVAEKLTLRDPEANPLETGDAINTVVIEES